MALQWYFVRCQSGREDSIARNAVTKIKIAGLQEAIPQVLVPFERITDLKNGKKRTVNQKLYPGYLMVQADIDDPEAGQRPIGRAQTRTVVDGEPHPSGDGPGEDHQARSGRHDRDAGFGRILQPSIPRAEPGRRGPERIRHLGVDRRAEDLRRLGGCRAGEAGKDTDDDEHSGSVHAVP